VFFQTTRLLESFEVGIRTPTLWVAELVVASIDLLTEISGIWPGWIWLLLFGVWTLGSLTDWFVALLLPLYWLLRFITLFDATILLFPVTNGFVPWLTACETFRFFCCSSYLAFSSFASSASLRATVFAIFLICWCRLFKQPKKLKFLDVDFAAFVLLYIMSNPPICSY